MSEDNSSGGLGNIPTNVDGIAADAVGESSETSTGTDSSTSQPSGQSSTSKTSDTTTFEDITEEKRIDIKVRIDSITESDVDSVQRILMVEDVSGESIRMKIWDTHDCSAEFKEDNWYELKEARLKIWERVYDKAGRDKKELSSTRDLEVSEVPHSSETKDSCEYTKSELLSDLEILRNKLGGPPSENDVKKIGKYNPGAYKQKFGSLEKALEETNEYSKEDLLNEIEEVAEKIDGTPSVRDIRKHGRIHSPSPVYSDFFDSFEEALDEADISYSMDEFTEEDAIDEIIEVAEEVDEVTSEQDLNSKLLSRVDDYLIEELTEVLGSKEEIKEKDIIEICRFHPQTYRHRFGSLDNAIQKAKARSGKREELLQEVEEVAKKLKVVPTRFEMAEHGDHLLNDFYDFFGSWKAVQENLLDQLERDGSTSLKFGNISGKGIHYFPMVLTLEAIPDDSTKKRYHMKTGSGDLVVLDIEGEHNIAQELVEGKQYEIKNTKVESYDGPNKRLSITEYTEIEKYSGEDAETRGESKESEASEEGIDTQSEVEDTVNPQGESKDRDDSVSERDMKLKRLNDLIELQPTDTSELSVRWDVDSEDEARRYLRSELDDYYEMGSIGIIATEEAREVAEGDLLEQDGTNDKTKSTDSKSAKEEPSKKEDGSSETEGESGRDDRSEKGVPTRDNLINDLQEVYSHIDTLPLQSDINEEGNYSSWEYTYEFGSLEDAYEAADINVKRELLDEIEKVADKLGKKPKPSEVTEHGRFSRQRYKTRFRSWSRALEMAETSVNSSSSQDHEKDSNTEDSQEGTTTSQEPTEANDEPSSGEDGILDSMKSFFESN